MFLATDEHGRWHPGIGDPTLMGWLTVLAYFATAWLCFRALKATLRGAGPALAGGSGHRRLSAFWLCLTLLMAFLGCNKQLDLQSLFTQIAKDLAIAQGWYEERRRYQLGFIVGVAASAVLATLGACYWLRRELRRLSDGLAGLGLLAGFIAIRAASFHHVDEWLQVELLGLRFNWIMELGAIGLIARSALRAGGSPRLPRGRLRRRAQRNSLGREEIPIKVRIRSTPPERD